MREDDTIDMFRLRRKRLSDVRGKKIHSPNIFELAECEIDCSAGTYWPVRRYVEWCGGKWLPINTTDEYDYFVQKKKKTARYIGAGDANMQVVSDTCMALAGIAFNRDLWWRVVIKGPSGSISLTTNPGGAMAAFADRDKNEKTNRRESLRNWVSQHYRKRASTGEKDIEVRKHLRGRTPFRWCGFDCEVVPAPFDQRLNERMREQKASSKRQTVRS